MKVLIEGHKYVLDNIKSDDGDVDVNTLKFYDASGENREEIIGTSNQEVLRALIDRVKFLDRQLPHVLNSEIIHHLRKALVLHEARHLDRLADKGVEIENYVTGNHGHFCIVETIKDSDEDGDELKMNVHFRKHLNFPPELNPNHVRRESFNQAGDWEGDNWPTTPKELRKFVEPLREGSLKGAYTDKEGVTKDIKNIDTLSMANAIDNTTVRNLYTDASAVIYSEEEEESFSKGNFNIGHVLDDTREAIEKIQEVDEAVEDFYKVERYEKQQLECTTVQLEFARAIAFELPSMIPVSVFQSFTLKKIEIKIHKDVISFLFFNHERFYILMEISKEKNTRIFNVLYSFLEILKAESERHYKFTSGSVEYRVLEHYDTAIEDDEMLRFRLINLMAGQDDKTLLELMLYNFATHIFRKHNDHLADDMKTFKILQLTLCFSIDFMDIEKPVEVRDKILEANEIICNAKKEFEETQEEIKEEQNAKGVSRK